MSTDVRTEQNRHPDAATRHARLPEADAEVVAAVHQLLALADHAVDNAADELLPLVHATPGTPPAHDPGLAHHTVNSVVRQDADGRVLAWSRRLTVTAAGRVASADLLDVVVAGPDGWRIAERTVLARHGRGGDVPW